MMKLLASALVAFAALPGPAHAAAKIIDTMPAANAAVKPPGKIILNFDAPLKPGTAGAEIIMTAMPGMADHPPMAIKAFTNELTNDQKSLVLKLKNPLPAGSYTIRWGATDAGGEALQGSMDFRVE